MASKGGRIDFMLYSPPPPYPAAGSATDRIHDEKLHCFPNEAFVKSKSGYVCQNHDSDIKGAFTHNEIQPDFSLKNIGPLFSS